ncbi:MAG: anaerobic ribonucleoside-triphosphate reductase activating protein [Eubacteriales bacterium]|nr:anaerobic ribonucleoside-triphosphate reductase activating protein [Eubacteriales bacterium]
MRIAGFLKQSFVDYPGQIAGVIFTAGCNYDCYYCHNRHILGGDAPQIDPAGMWEFLEKRRGLLDGVVVTGGEPCLHDDLPELLARLRGMGFLVKLDTNGSRPEMVERVLAAGLVDHVAMDIKAPWAKYPQICRAAGDEPRRTLEVLRRSGVAWEARTTFAPELTVQDIGTIARENAPLPVYAVQAYRKPESWRAEDAARLETPPHSAAELTAAVEAARPYCAQVLLRD